MPTQNLSTRGKKITEWLKNENVKNHSVMDWVESAKQVYNPGDRPWKGEA